MRKAAARTGDTVELYTLASESISDAEDRRKFIEATPGATHPSRARPIQSRARFPARIGSRSGKDRPRRSAHAHRGYAAHGAAAARSGIRRPDHAAPGRLPGAGRAGRGAQGGAEGRDPAGSSCSSWPGTSACRSAARSCARSATKKPLSATP